MLENDVRGVSLSGEVDHHGAVGVRSDIDELIFEKRPKKLVLDLSSVSFMDSSGLGLIMGRYSLMKDLGGKLLLKDPPSAVMRILSLAGIERLIRIEKTNKEEVKK
ncbi:MAG: anti-sigma factor antagonist [Clostridia bacterium]|nr:anti-sigma factor antagonist [Clostridia bacterium]